MIWARVREAITYCTCAASRVSSKQSIFFGFEPKLNLFWLFFGCFAKPKTIFFGLFRRFRPVSKQPKQTKLFRNKTEKYSRNALYQGVLEALNFVFYLVFSRNPKICFQFVSVFWTGIETTKTNRTYGMGYSKGLHVTNLLLFRLVFCMFRLFRNTETPCLDIKAKKTERNVLFRIVPKLVSVPVLVVSLGNQFRRTPQLQVEQNLSQAVVSVFKGIDQRLF